jgi:hypothetical protein
MAFKLLAQAEKHWRRINSPHLVALVQAGVRFHDGKTQILSDLQSESVAEGQLRAAPDQMIRY